MSKYNAVIANTVTAGPSLSVSVDANNHITSVFGLTYDANGNQSGANYDAENRISSILQGETYLYYCCDAQNKRIFSWDSALDTLDNRNVYTVYYYTPAGQKLGAYQFNIVQNGPPPTLYVTLMNRRKRTTIIKSRPIVVRRSITRPELCDKENLWI